MQKIVQNVKCIAIKKLLFVIEMSQHGNKSMDFSAFMECYDASTQNDLDEEYDIATLG